MLTVKIYLNDSKLFYISSNVVRYYYEDAYINGKHYKTKRLVISTPIPEEEHAQLAAIEAANETFLIECSEFFNDEETTMCKITHMDQKCVEFEIL